jgi:UDP-glucose:(heptosyl)LPS alpha-1,3-glucosyltransferase
VVYNGVNLIDFNFDQEKRQEMRGKLGLKDDEVALLFSGYEFGRKGLGYILKSLPKISDGAKLLVVGNDDPLPYEKLASKLGVRDKVVFAGFVPDIAACYAASDIFVFPTIYEPFGLVITEALSTGLPVVTSKLAGAAEIMDDGRDGLLLNDPTDQSEIAEKINFLIDNEDIRRAIGDNGRKTAKKYSWNVAAQKTMDVYEEVMRS